MPGPQGACASLMATSTTQMPVRSAQEIRTLFLEYFRDLPGSEHHILASAPLVPLDDPTILLINAGMTPLKKYFTGQETPPSPRMADVQKCIRTLDIEQVGRTPRHCTFFEMLGNFSIGDYFKAEIIPWAWTFLTEVLGIPTEKLMVSVHENDQEAWDLWRSKVGLPESKIVRLGDEDNFWVMAETGPCGPDTEIFYDLGPRFGSTKGEYDGPGSAYGRWIEIWNLVFTQFDRQADGSLVELPKKNVDTGAGLERMCVVLQQKDTVFETDGFQPLIGYFQTETKNQLTGARVNPYYVLADHLRATAFLMADGVLPDRVGRGYVLRRIMRRAMSWGNRLGFGPGVWAGALPILRDLMGTQYPEIVQKGAFIADRIATEEELFLRTLHRGETLLARELEDLRSANAGTLPATFPGDKAFTLFDTYGFPLDLTKDLVEDHGLTVDEAAFQAALAEQRARSKADTKAKLGAIGSGSDAASIMQAFDQFPPTLFLGYSGATSGDTLLLGAISAGEAEVLVALEQTPFYAESGGQIGDRGTISAIDGRFVLEVRDTQKTPGGVFLHRCKLVSGTTDALEPETPVRAEIDTQRRTPTMRAHSTAHLLHSALKQVLGEHVEQAGSLVEPDRIRFDFKHFEAMTAEQVAQVDTLVNEWILADFPVEKMEMPIAEARAMGAVALFGEKYGEQVRVLRMGPVSLELCGGTHLNHTAEAGAFVLVREESIAAGTRRVTGYTGMRAMEYLFEQEAMVARLAGELKAKRTLEDLLGGLERLRDESRALRTELATLKEQLALSQVGDLIAKGDRRDQTLVLASQVEGASAETLRTIAQAIRDREASCALLLIGGEEGKYNTLVALSEDVIAAGHQAGKLIGEVGKLLGAGGGGRPDMAQGGGKDGSQIPDALALFRSRMLTGQT